MPDFSTFIVFGDGIRSSSLCLAFHTILDVFGNSRHNIKRSPTCMRLAFRLAGSCSIPWRVDAERADLRLGRRGILMDGAGGASALWCSGGSRGSVECHLTVSLEIPKAARSLAPEPFWKPTSTS